MPLPQHGNHVLFGDVRVALRRGDRRMSQELLHNADIHAIA